MACAELAHVLEITQATRRVAAAQPLIELGVAWRCVLATIVERPVQGEHAARRQERRYTGEQLLDLRPGNDVAGIGAEHRVGRHARKWLVDIELDRLEEPRRLRLFAPEANAGQILGDVARLP